MDNTINKIYRWGIIGCGNISYDFCNCLTASQRSNIAACAARSMQSAKAFAQKFDIPTVYDSYDAIAKDDSIDIAYIGTIHTTHYDSVITCLTNGKHVICEKPMGINTQQVKSMIDCARRNQRFLLDALWTRCFPATKEVKKWINDGKIGNVVSVTNDFSLLFEGSVPSTGHYMWFNKFAGGHLTAIGIYMIDAITRIMGLRMPKISALGVIDEKYKIDMIVAINMLYADSCQYGQTRTDQCSNSNEECYINGTKGVIKIHTMHAPTKIELYDNNFSKKEIIETKEFPLMDCSMFRYKEFNYHKSEGLYYEIEETIKCLDNGLLQSNEYKWEEMILNYKILDEVRRQIGLKFPQDSNSKL